MKIMWVMGKEMSRLAVEPKCLMAVGVTEVQELGSMYPIVALEYTLDDLEVLMPVFTEMKNRSLNPVCHLWETNRGPEACVLFRLQNPSRETFEKVLGKDMLPVSEVISEDLEKCEVLIVSAAGGDKEFFSLFFEKLNEHGFAAVTVGKQSTDTHVIPMMSFVVEIETILRHEPAVTSFL